ICDNENSRLYVIRLPILTRFRKPWKGHSGTPQLVPTPPYPRGRERLVGCSGGRHLRKWAGEQGQSGLRIAGLKLAMLKGGCWRHIRRRRGQSSLLRGSWVLVTCVMTMAAALGMVDAAIDPLVLVLRFSPRCSCSPLPPLSSPSSSSSSTTPCLISSTATSSCSRCSRGPSFSRPDCKAGSWTEAPLTCLDHDPVQSEGAMAQQSGGDVES
ncbi:unnamed protein product, partial [Sphagnum balticum]